MSETMLGVIIYCVVSWAYEAACLWRGRERFAARTAEILDMARPEGFDPADDPPLWGLAAFRVSIAPTTLPLRLLYSLYSSALDGGRPS